MLFRSTVPTPVSQAAGDPDAWNILAPGFEPWPFVILANETLLHAIDTSTDRNVVVGSPAVVHLGRRDLANAFVSVPGGDDFPAAVDQRRGTVTVTATQAPGMRAREALQTSLEEISGGRMHTMITRVGGLANDAPPGWFEGLLAAVALAREELRVMGELLPDVVAGDGVAVLHRVDAIGFGVSGPVARASGLDLDARRDHPYLAYAELIDVLCVEGDSHGDANARYEVLRRQAIADLDLIVACIERIPDGPINVPLPKVVRAPEGEAYARVESAIGVNGVYLVSAGGPTPWRVRLRTASYANAQAMSAALPGTALVDLVSAVSSFCFVAGDIDH